MQLAHIPFLHAVTSDAVLERGDFIASALRVMAAGGPRVAVHLRSGTLTGRELTHLAEQLASEQESTGAWLVINDRVDVARAVGARAAQLTSRSISVADARLAAPCLAIGASVHDMDSAVTAAYDGAAWVVAGHVFDTPSHEGMPGRGLAFVKEISAAIATPVIAIGGVRPQHVATLRIVGAAGVAAIRGVWSSDAESAGRAALDYLSAYDVSDASDRTARGDDPGDDPGDDRGDDRGDRQR